MKKMKTGLMMVCLTVLLSCAALMMNTPTASAMTLQDLVGDYRVVGGDAGRISGSIVTLKMENGNLIGIVKQKSSGATYWVNGGVFMRDVYVENGVIHCQAIQGNDDVFSDMVVEVYSNGKTLRYIWNSNWMMHELHRL